jgi:hypothetical protein
VVEKFLDSFALAKMRERYRHELKALKTFRKLAIAPLSETYLEKSMEKFRDRFRKPLRKEQLQNS